MEVVFPFSIVLGHIVKRCAGAAKVIYDICHVLSCFTIKYQPLLVRNNPKSFTTMYLLGDLSGDLRTMHNVFNLPARVFFKHSGIFFLSKWLLISVMILSPFTSAIIRYLHWPQALLLTVHPSQAMPRKYVSALKMYIQKVVRAIFFINLVFLELQIDYVKQKNKNNFNALYLFSHIIFRLTWSYFPW